MNSIKIMLNQYKGHKTPINHHPTKTSIHPPVLKLFFSPKAPKSLFYQKAGSAW
jgi:hypothetical protein